MLVRVGLCIVITLVIIFKALAARSSNTYQQFLCGEGSDFVVVVVHLQYRQSSPSICHESRGGYRVDDVASRCRRSAL